jgi:hypothetical protein
LVAFLGFVGIGASYGAAGRGRSGALAGVAVYLLIGSAVAAIYELRFGTDLVGFAFMALIWPFDILNPSFWAGGA